MVMGVAYIIKFIGFEVAEDSATCTQCGCTTNAGDRVGMIEVNAQYDIARYSEQEDVQAYEGLYRVCTECAHKEGYE